MSDTTSPAVEPEDNLDLGARVMPDFVRRGLIRVQGGLPYLKASHRVLWMREEHPDWSITTEIVHADYASQFVVMKATISDADGKQIATAHYEKKGGNTPFLRTAETGAVARALGLCGYGTQFGELDEDEADIADSPQGGYRDARQPERSQPRQQPSTPERGTPPKRQTDNGIITDGQQQAIRKICEAHGWDAETSSQQWYSQSLSALTGAQAAEMIVKLNKSVKAAATADARN